MQQRSKQIYIKWKEETTYMNKDSASWGMGFRAWTRNLGLNIPDRRRTMMNTSASDFYNSLSYTKGYR